MNNTLVNGLALLEVLAQSQVPLGVTGIVEQAGVNKSSVHRLLQGLIDLNFVCRDVETRLYKPSVRLWSLAAAAIANLDVRQASLLTMRELLAVLNETVHLSVLEGEEVVYVAKLESSEPVRAYSQVGGRAPAHCVATGKALLAHEPQARLDALRGRLQGFTSCTIVDDRLFAKEVGRVRARGYAVNRGEWRESVRGVAAPIFGVDRIAVAAIGISAPASRLKAGQYGRIGEVLKVAARDISNRLAGASGSPLLMDRLDALNLVHSTTPTLSNKQPGRIGLACNAPDSHNRARHVKI